MCDGKKGTFKQTTWLQAIKINRRTFLKKCRLNNFRVQSLICLFFSTNRDLIIIIILIYIYYNIFSTANTSSISSFYRSCQYTIRSWRIREFSIYNTHKRDKMRANNACLIRFSIRIVAVACQITIVYGRRFIDLYVTLMYDVIVVWLQ